MFKINYRIVDDYDALKLIDYEKFDLERNHITGFFEILIGEHQVGCYYHENALREGEVGSELLTYWFHYLLETAHNIPITNYVAFKELETFDRWIEFKLYNNTVMINIAVDNKRENHNLFITEKYNGFTYVNPVDFAINIVDFKKEISNAVNRFIAEVKKINPDLLKTRCVEVLLHYLI